MDSSRAGSISIPPHTGCGGGCWQAAIKGRVCRGGSAPTSCLHLYPNSLLAPITLTTISRIVVSLASAQQNSDYFDIDAFSLCCNTHELRVAAKKAYGETEVSTSKSGAKFAQARRLYPRTYAHAGMVRPDTNTVLLCAPTDRLTFLARTEIPAPYPHHPSHFPYRNQSHLSHLLVSCRVLGSLCVGPKQD